MALTNTPTRFGSVTRLLHWLTALLIIALFPLGLIANDLPYDSAEALARKAQLFSIHKTLGIATFAVALLRILWALAQRHRPGALHPERRAETFLAGLVHWLLYASLVIVPLTGWIAHAASVGFAPIWWPFGQELPLIPDNVVLAETFGTLHVMAKSLLLVAIGLHVAGALKHALIDRDGTLARMATGRDIPVPPSQGSHAAPAIAALAIWAALLGAGSLAAPSEPEEIASEAPVATPDSALAANWTVTEGSLGIAVQQMGSTVEGSFATWSAAIDFDPATSSGQTEVTIDIASLTLGSVTDQALGADFLDATGHPTARFAATLAADPATAGAYLATGTLSLRGVEVPVTLPFTLTPAGEAMAMAGSLTLDRRDFAVGAGTMPDDSSLGFEVVVTIALTATPKAG